MFSNLLLLVIPCNSVKYFSYSFSTFLIYFLKCFFFHFVNFAITDGWFRAKEYFFHRDIYLLLQSLQNEKRETIKKYIKNIERIGNTRSSITAEVSRAVILDHEKAPWLCAKPRMKVTITIACRRTGGAFCSREKVETLFTEIIPDSNCS